MLNSRPGRAIGDRPRPAIRESSVSRSISADAADYMEHLLKASSILGLIPVQRADGARVQREPHVGQRVNPP